MPKRKKSSRKKPKSRISKWPVNLARKAERKMAQLAEHMLTIVLKAVVLLAYPA